MYVVVQFYPWFNFCFPLFYIHYYKLPYTQKRKTKIETRIKLNHNTYSSWPNSWKATEKQPSIMLIGHVDCMECEIGGGG